MAPKRGFPTAFKLNRDDNDDDVYDDDAPRPVSRTNEIQVVTGRIVQHIYAAATGFPKVKDGNDYRFGRFNLLASNGQMITLVGMSPLGAKRLSYKYKYKVEINKMTRLEENKIVDFPVLHHHGLAIHKGLVSSTECTFSQEDDNRLGGDGYFSIYAFMKGENQLKPLISSANFHTFLTIRRAFAEASDPDRVDRDILAVFYANVDLVMQKLFAMHIRRISTFTILSICDCLARVYKTPERIFEPFVLQYLAVKGLDKLTIKKKYGRQNKRGGDEDDDNEEFESDLAELDMDAKDNKQAKKTGNRDDDGELKYESVSVSLDTAVRLWGKQSSHGIECESDDDAIEKLTSNKKAKTNEDDHGVVKIDDIVVWSRRRTDVRLPVPILTGLPENVWQRQAVIHAMTVDYYSNLNFYFEHNMIQNIIAMWTGKGRTTLDKSWANKNEYNTDNNNNAPKLFPAPLNENIIAKAIFDLSLQKRIIITKDGVNEYTEATLEEIADSNSKLRFCHPFGWNLETSNSKFVAKLVNEDDGDRGPVKDLQYKHESSKPGDAVLITCNYGNKVNAADGVEFPDCDDIVMQIPLCQGPDFVYSADQTKALVTGYMRNLALIYGPGGTGKSTILTTLAYLYREKYGPQAVLVFTAFKNNTVNQMRSAILKNRLNEGEIKKMDEVQIDKEGKYKSGNCVFSTCDSIASNMWWIKENSNIKVAAVIIDEAGNISSSHLNGVFSACSELMQLVLIGDSRQRSPINGGIPFRNLTDVFFKKFAVGLSRNYRTNCLDLLHKQRCILDAEEAPFFVDIEKPDGSFYMTDIGYPSSYRREKDYMDRFALELINALDQHDPQRKQYNESIVLNPYKDFCDLGNIVMANYYFRRPDDQLTRDEIVRRSLSAKKTDEPLYIGMRIVFDETDYDKRLYSRGQTARIAHIWDQEYLNDKDAGDIIDFHVKHTKMPFARYAKGHIRRILHLETDDGTKVSFDFRENTHGSLFDHFSPASCITVDRSQGCEYDYVYGLLPWGRNMVDNSMIYTQVSRAKKRAHVIGDKGHIAQHVKTKPEFKHSNFKDMLKKIMK